MELDPNLFGTWQVDRWEIETYEDGALVNFYSCPSCGEFYFQEDGRGNRNTSLGYQGFSWRSTAGRVQLIPDGASGREDWIVYYDTENQQDWEASVFYEIHDPIVGTVTREDRMRLFLRR